MATTNDNPRVQLEEMGTASHPWNHQQNGGGGGGGHHHHPHHPPNTTTGVAATGHDGLSRAITSLKRDEWEADTPVCIDGENWTEDVREVATLHMLNAFQRNRTARALIVQNTILDLKTQLAFGQVFESCKQVVSVTVRNVQCSPGQPILPSSVFRLASLRHLALEKCILTESLCNELVYHTRRSSSLHSLVLKHVTWNGDFKFLHQAIKHTTSLVRLHVQGLIPFTEKNIHKLLVAVKVNRSIRVLELEQMRLNVHFARRLSNLLVHNPRIIEMSLRRNQMSEDALMALTVGLERNTTLRSLALSHNPVKDDGVQHLVSLLRKNQSLRKLCLIDCEISKDGCLAIVNALPSFKGLQHLNADMNEMEACVIEIEDALRYNTVIGHLLCGLPQLMQEQEEDQRTSSRSTRESDTNSNSSSNNAHHHLNQRDQQQEGGGGGGGNGNNEGIVDENTSEKMMKNLKRWKMIDFFLRANHAKRRALDYPGIPSILVPSVLEKACDQPDVLNYFIHALFPLD